MLRPAEPISNIQIHDFQGVVLDELAPRFDVFSHERRENIFSRDGVFELHFEERARIRVHRGFPELRRIHFAEALEPRDGEIFLRVFHHVAQHVLRFFLGGLVAVARDEEGRLVEFLDLFRERAQALVFGRGRQRPVDFLVVRRAKLDFVQAVLFVESDFFSSNSAFLSRPLSESSSARPASRRRRPSFAATASCSCTFSRNEVSPAPCSVTPSLPLTTWSSVARFINSRAKSRSSRMYFSLFPRFTR